MSDTASEVQFAVQTLTAVLRHEHRRLSIGSTLRSYIHKQLALGQEPNHYRIEFLRNGVFTLIATLKTLAEDFNRTQENDKAGIGDLMDILESTTRTMRSRAGYTD